MREHSFAVMTMAGGGDIQATHLPMVLDEGEGELGTLYGHIAANNPQAQSLNGDTAALIMFSGPHAYISADWYETPEKRVPTWNYISVQAKGFPTRLPKEKWLGEMERLTHIYEGDDGWKVSKAQDYVDALMRGIVYFKMEITSLQSIEKMSQNKSHSENQTVISELRARKETQAADAMVKAMDRGDV